MIIYGNYVKYIQLKCVACNIVATQGKWRLIHVHDRWKRTDGIVSFIDDRLIQDTSASDVVFEEWFDLWTKKENLFFWSFYLYSEIKQVLMLVIFIISLYKIHK